MRVPGGASLSTVWRPRHCEVTRQLADFGLVEKVTPKIPISLLCRTLSSFVIIIFFSKNASKHPVPQMLLEEALPRLGLCR